MGLGISRHLSYPGHSLRKHHPPDHYSVDLAIRGHRSGAATDGVWLRFERDCHRGHPLADRHRQEERHYAYPRHPSRRARTRPPAGGGDLSSLHQTLPADSHDDDGGDARGRAAHARHWNRLRDTRAARLRHRWRVGTEPILDALYNPGRLPLSRSFDQMMTCPYRKPKTADRDRESVDTL